MTGGYPVHLCLCSRHTRTQKVHKREIEDRRAETYASLIFFFLLYLSPKFTASCYALPSIPPILFCFFPFLSDLKGPLSLSLPFRYRIFFFFFFFLLKSSGQRRYFLYLLGRVLSST
ncbi:hypothetical protein B0T13DRAFT_455657 [Neurospora crassa]|nr:hypothetical protein B0T13DRAFT_455657 [Neurospora crassa]